MYVPIPGLLSINILLYRSESSVIKEFRTCTRLEFVIPNIILMNYKSRDEFLRIILYLLNELVISSFFNNKLIKQKLILNITLIFSIKFASDNDILCS